MKAQPFFSVIIPTFNRAELLKSSVSSVLDQTFTDLELIVSDDGSEDNTAEVIRSFDDPRLRYIRSANKGVSSARNRALEKAGGRYIAFLDSDDRWEPDKLTITSGYIRSRPDIPIFHTEEIWYRAGEVLDQKKKHRKPEGDVYINALPLCCISISTAVIKAELLKEANGFDENLEACEDYDLWLRLTSRYPVKLIPEALTVKDGGRPDQLSSSIWGLDRFRIKALEKILTSGQLSRPYASATLNELRKKCRIFALGAAKRGRTEAAEYYRELPRRYEDISG
ncbi:MAG: glycosyltransferase [Candidatus Omnitrophica bacterium]|nr:glycosyltransferase [Candidatus Omnitrophota bacterium]